MKLLKFALIIALIPMVSGCLSVVSVSTRIQFDEEKKKATVFTIYEDIVSDKNSQKDIQSDFEDLIQVFYQSDEIVLEAAEDGFGVLERIR